MFNTKFLWVSRWIQVEILFVTLPLQILTSLAILCVTSAFTERCGEKWEVTKVVEKEELGKPAERLKEKIAKPQLLASSDEKAANYNESSKGRDAMLEQMLWA